MPSTIADNYRVLMDDIAETALKAGRDADTVKLVGASKTVSVERLRQAVSAGLAILGENYLQEAREKILAFDLPVEWHFIGHLQSNKAAAAVKLFSLIHSLDRSSLAKALNDAAAKTGRTQNVLLEVNLAQEPSKSGVGLEDLENLLKTCAALPHLRVKGLMTMPPWHENPQKIRSYFKALHKAKDHLQSLRLPEVDLVELSMGMSGDYKVAIEEGATLIRIGTALFGARPH